MLGTTVNVKATIWHSVSWSHNIGSDGNGGIAYISQATARLPQDFWKGRKISFSNMSLDLA
jgi:hypothetical protein